MSKAKYIAITVNSIGNLGNATTATTATNVANGVAGSIHYQSAASTTAMTAFYFIIGNRLGGTSVSK